MKQELHEDDTSKSSVSSPTSSFDVEIHDKHNVQLISVEANEQCTLSVTSACQDSDGKTLSDSVASIVSESKASEMITAENQCNGQNKPDDNLFSVSNRGLLGHPCNNIDTAMKNHQDSPHPVPFQTVKRKGSQENISISEGPAMVDHNSMRPAHLYSLQRSNETDVLTPVQQRASCSAARERRIKQDASCCPYAHDGLLAMKKAEHDLKMKVLNEKHLLLLLEIRQKKEEHDLRMHLLRLKRPAFAEPSLKSDSEVDSV